MPQCYWLAAVRPHWTGSHSPGNSHTARPSYPVPACPGRRTSERTQMSAPAPRSFQTVAVDLDGSLAGTDHRLSPRAIRVLAALERQGTRPIIITGRTVAAARAAWGEAGLSAPVISCNGAVIEDPTTGKRLAEHHLPPQVVADLLTLGEHTGLTVTLWTPERMHAARRDAHIELLEDLNDEQMVIGPLQELTDEPVVKAMLAGPPEGLDAAAGKIVAAVPSMQRSLPTFFETSPPGANKAGALLHVLEHLDVPPSTCLGVGDGDTDVEWLSMIAYPVAPANARPAVRDIAAEIVGHHADDGVAIFLDRYFGLNAE